MFWKKKKPSKDEIEMAYDLIQFYRSKLLPYNSVKIIMHETEFYRFLKMIGMFNLYVDCMEKYREPESYSIPMEKYNRIRYAISSLCSNPYPNFVILEFYMEICKHLRMYEMLKQDIHSKNFKKLLRFCWELE